MHPNEDDFLESPRAGVLRTLGHQDRKTGIVVDGRKIPLSIFLHVNKLTDFQHSVLSKALDIQATQEEYAEVILQLQRHADQLSRANWKPNKVEGDAVNRPDHYERFSIEPTFFARENGLTWNIGNFLKYVCRFPFKNGVEDLRKAARYLAMEVRFLDGKQDWSR
jgi:hypothetical protein